MDIDNLREDQMPDQAIGGDWRTQLTKDSRQRIVNKIMETLKRHLPFDGQEGLQELKKIAVRFEEKVYTAATSQSDYLRKISLKMLSMETKSQNSMANSLHSNAASSSKSPQYPDSSSQIGSAADEDWQEGTYQKIKSMHEMYYPELNETYQRMSAKLQQIEARPQQPKNEQLEKLRFLKLMLERLIMFLRTNKNDIQPNHKDKIGRVEKQIVYILNPNRPRKPVPSMQQGQLTQPLMHPMQQSQQMHSAEGQINSQKQPMDIQGSLMSMQQNNLTSLQYNTLSSGSSVSNCSQNMLGRLQAASNIDPRQGNALNQMQQVAMNSLLQNSAGGSQQMTSSISSQNGMTALQSNVNSLQSNSSILLPQQIKQEQPMFLTQHLKQQYQQRQIQQPYMQRQQLIQQQQQLQQQTSQQQSVPLLGQQLMQYNQKMQQIIRKQQLTQQLQQQTSQLQPAQLHAQQHMLNQQSLLQQMPSLQQKQQQFQLLNLNTSLQQSQHLQLMQFLQQKQQQQQLLLQQTYPQQSSQLIGQLQLMPKEQQQQKQQQTSQKQTYPQQSSQLIGQLQLMPKEQQQQKQQQTSQKQSEHVHGKEQDLEKQLLIPKQQNSQKTASVSLVILGLLLLALVSFLCGEVLRTYQLYRE